MALQGAPNQGFTAPTPRRASCAARQICHVVPCRREASSNTIDPTDIRCESPSVELTPDMQRVVLEQRLGFVATVSKDGKPNLSPKGTTTIWDGQRLVFADIASPQTVENLRSNPYIEVNVVDPIVRKGYRFKGLATAYADGLMYERGLEILRERGSTISPQRIKSIVVIEVNEASPVVSPAYDDGASEESVAERWLKHHTALHGPSAGVSE